MCVGVLNFQGVVFIRVRRAGGGARVRASGSEVNRVKIPELCCITCKLSLSIIISSHLIFTHPARHDMLKWRCSMSVHFLWDTSKPYSNNSIPPSLSLSLLPSLSSSPSLPPSLRVCVCAIWFQGSNDHYLQKRGILYFLRFTSIPREAV